MAKWLLRVFASSVVRRVAYLLVAVVVAALASGRAHAMGGSFPDAGQAYATCMSEMNQLMAQNPSNRRNPECRARPDENNGLLQFDGGLEDRACSSCNWNAWGANSYYSYPKAATCSTRPPQYGWLADAQHQQACYQGCVYDSTLDVESGAKYYKPAGGVCESSTDTPEPKVDSDGDGVPDDQDAFPNDPNESKDSDGDGIGDNADVAPNDPTNGDDKEDGDEKDNQAGGGGDCNAPPSCSGDAIACNSNFQLWKLRCSGANVTGSPEVCTAGYSCSGDSAQCAQIALLRKSACAGQVGAGDGGFGTGDSANLAAIKNALTNNDAPPEAPAMPWLDGAADAASDWTSGLAGDAACPAPISRTISLGGYSQAIEFSYQPLCDFATLLRVVVLALGATVSAYIIAGVRK